MLCSLSENIKTMRTAISTDPLLGRDSAEMPDVSELTEEQRGHISLIVSDLKRINK